MLLNNFINEIYPSKLTTELLLPKLFERATRKICLIFLLELVVQSCSLRIYIYTGKSWFQPNH